jgi:hypothetical protein
VAAAGGVAEYSGSLSLREVDTIKGFSYEQSLVRRLNARAEGTKFRVASAGHPFVDLEEIDRITGRILRKYQVYAGSNPRKAVEKLLLSDKEADRHIFPEDVFDRIHQSVRECEAIHRQVAQGRLDAKTGERLIRRRAGRGGFWYDEAKESLYAGDPRGGRANLGRLGTGEIGRALGCKLLPDPDRLTSESITRDQFKLLLEANAKWQPLRRALAENKAAWEAIYARHQFLAALPAAEQTELNRAISQAAIAGVAKEEIQGILTDFGSGMKGRISFADTIHRLHAGAEKAGYQQRMRGAQLLAGFALVGAAGDFAFSDQDFEQWLHSGRLTEHSGRFVTGLVAMQLAQSVERKLADGLEKGAAKRVGARVFRVRLVGLGVANGIFLAGEGLIGLLSGDAGSEVVAKLGEGALVMVIAEGTVMAAELAFAGEIGAFGGPVGFAIAAGAAIAYEGAKYVWTAPGEHNTDRRIFLTRCEAAQEKVKDWAKNAQTKIGSNVQR